MELEEANPVLIIRLTGGTIPGPTLSFHYLNDKGVERQAQVGDLSGTKEASQAGIWRRTLNWLNMLSEERRWARRLTAYGNDLRIRVQQAIDVEINRGTREFVVDLRVDHIDSKGLMVLFDWYKLARSRGAAICALSANLKLRKLLKGIRDTTDQVCLADLVRLFDDVDEAREYLSGAAGHEKRNSRRGV